MENPDMSERNEVFRGQGISKIYVMGEVEVHALRSVDIDLIEGELLVLLGASGSGRSTSLNILGGSIRPPREEPSTGIRN